LGSSIKLRFDAARLLKVVLIEMIGRALESLHRAARADVGVRQIGHAEQCYRAEDIGSNERTRPRNRRTPIVTGDNRLLLSEPSHEPDDIASEIEDVVRLDRFGSVGASVTALIGSNDAEARRGQLGNLMTPGVPRLRPSV